MLYQLQKLSEQERLAVQQSPVWVTLLIACANHDIEESEIDRAKELGVSDLIIKTEFNLNEIIAKVKSKIG